MLVIVTDPASVDTARDVVEDLNGGDYTEYRVVRSDPPLREMRELVQRLRVTQPHKWVGINLGTDVLTHSCPKVEIALDKHAPASVKVWVDRAIDRYGDRVRVVPAASTL